MNYIINPSWFYLLSVSNGAKIVFGLFAALIGTGALTITCWYVITAIGDADGSTYNYIAERKGARPYLVGLWIAFFVFLLIWLFMPSRDTLIEMMIAKQATYENAQWTLETLKSAVDYIVNAIKSVK